MRALSLALALTAFPVVAQVQAPDSTEADAPPDVAVLPEVRPGLYVEGSGGGGWGGNSIGLLAYGDVALGYRLPSGLAVGGRVAGALHGARGGALTVMPELRYGHAIDDRTAFDLRLGVAASLRDHSAYLQDGLRMRSVSGIAEATVSRRFDLGKGARFVPIAGVYGLVGRSAGTAFDVGGTTYDRDGLFAEAGVVAGAQVEFTLFGGRLAVGPVLAIPAVRQGPGSPLGLDPARVGVRRSLVTFTF